MAQIDIKREIIIKEEVVEEYSEQGVITSESGSPSHIFSCQTNIIPEVSY